MKWKKKCIKQIYDTIKENEECVNKSMNKDLYSFLTVLKFGIMQVNNDNNIVKLQTILLPWKQNIKEAKKENKTSFGFHVIFFKWKINK